MTLEDFIPAVVTGAAGFMVGWWAKRGEAKKEALKERLLEARNNRTPQQAYLAELAAREFPALSRHDDER
jgi:hypothetical protein